MVERERLACACRVDDDRTADVRKFDIDIRRYRTSQKYAVAELLDVAIVQDLDETPTQVDNRHPNRVRPGKPHIRIECVGNVPIIDLDVVASGNIAEVRIVQVYAPEQFVGKIAVRELEEIFLVENFNRSHKAAVFKI
jgi:threonine dehydrogenase-like Zn-dependent dehydrogenase